MNYDHEPHGVFFMIDNKSFYASVESVTRGDDPLTSVIVVMSEAENTNGGLILAASPKAKELFGISNVSRCRDLPDDPRLKVVPPRMNLYIKKNLQINEIFTQFVADEDCYPYSIDESILDMTKSWRLFGRTPLEVAHRMQTAVHDQLGLWTTVGIGENPVQAKLALDLFAKHDDDRLGKLTYETFPQKIWPITDLVSVWSIGHRTAAHLNRVGIHSMNELAHSNPYELKAEFGIIGTQLLALAWGIDRSRLSNLITPNDKSWGNSQVLARDYLVQQEIETVIKEIGNQVTSRMRHHQQQAGCVSLMIGFSYDSAEGDGRSGFAHSMRIDATDSPDQVNQYLLYLFRKTWSGEGVRNIAVGLSHLSANDGLQLNLFKDPHAQIKQNLMIRVLDKIHDQFGNTALVPASSLLHGATMLERASLVGGHNGGNSFD
ncbi:excinuclease ABC subunit A [Pediococcus ethanolidurans]|uniref:Y-family DNA polymerase n=1 Tax=Pediococcus ethanolidurans TaxID=319653 RepID=UPI0021AA0506|nr:excinuclease ABC subunit A [Pediococcus ethanolidurans]MCT4397598.1 excinuclease ABC subunit A [Pediococcus ethanolidurans]